MTGVPSAGWREVYEWAGVHPEGWRDRGDEQDVGAGRDREERPEYRKSER
jgi:hypothetical protein